MTSNSHAPLHPPLPALSKNQTPQTLEDLVHFLNQPSYTEVNHPDKFGRWTRGLLDRILPLDFGGETVRQGSGSGQSQGQGQGQTQNQNQNQQAPGQGPSSQQPQSQPQPNPNPDNSTANTNPNSTQNAREPRCSDLELHLLQREIQGVDGGMENRWGLVLWILARHFQTPLTPQTHPVTLLDLLERVFQTVRAAGWYPDLAGCDKALGLIVRYLGELGVMHRCPDRVYNLAHHAVNVVASRAPTSLSSVHPWFVEMCYLNKRDREAEGVLGRLIDDVTVFKIHPMDFIQYHLYGGLIKLRGRQWEAAREYLELAVTAPVETFAPMQLEAHYKLVLVNLIIEGKTFVYPSYISSAMTKVIRDQGKTYDKLATAFEERSAGLVFMAKTEDYVKENNVDLLREVQRAFIEWQIMDLTKIYSKLFLEDVAARIYARDGLGKISIGDVGGFIDDLVARGKLFATITADPLIAPRPFVTFVENPEVYRSKSTVDHLNALIRQSKATGALATQRDRKMGLENEFLNKVIRRDEPSSGLAGSMADAPSGIKVPAMKGVGSNWNDMGY